MVEIHHNKNVHKTVTQDHILDGWSLEPECLNHSKYPDICGYRIVTGENGGS